MDPDLASPSLRPFVVVSRRPWVSVAAFVAVAVAGAEPHSDLPRCASLADTH